jgi:hypothetical protein
MGHTVTKRASFLVIIRINGYFTELVKVIKSSLQNKREVNMFAVS